MTQKAQALALAEPDTSLRASLDEACQGAGYELSVEPSAEVATSKLSARRYDALVLDMTTPGAALVCLKARGKLVRTRIPVIALVEEEDEVSFARAYRAGADEVLVAGRPAALTARLRSLPKSGIPQPGTARGDAVVADADRARAEVLERVLRDAGFRVELAVDGFAARLQVGRPALKVAVLDASLDDAPALITQARTRGARCAWIVRGRPDGLDALRNDLAKLDRVAIVNAYGPPDDVLFEINRLLEPRESDGRADKRQLYGTIVRLKWDGQRDVDIGYAYNVSSVGIYVRTLAAPSGSTVELELMPPGMDTLVKLKAEVIWRREFGATRREPVPAGFGVKLTGGDLDVWTKACPRALSLPPQSLRPALLQVAASEPPPQSTLTTVRPDAPPVDPGPFKEEAAAREAKEPSVPAPERAAGAKRSSSADKLRLPERLHAPIGGVFAAISKPQKEPSPPPPKVVEKDQPASPVPLREPQSSVEEMLLSVLGGSSPGEDVLGAAPLSIDGGEVVELEKEGAAQAPSEEPPPPPSIDPPPASSPEVEVRMASMPAAPPRPEPQRGNSDAPSIELHRRPSSGAPAQPEESWDGPTREIATRSAPDLPRVPPPPPPIAKPQTAASPKPPRAEPALVPPPKPPPVVPPPPPPSSEAAELIEAEPLPSDPPPKAPPSSKHSTMTGVGPSSRPSSLEAESKEPLPDELQRLATTARAKEAEELSKSFQAKALDPLAATVRVERSPVPPEALRDVDRPAPRLADVKAPPPVEESTVTPAAPSTSSIEPEPEIPVPESRTPRWLWLSAIGIAAGILSFFAVPVIRNAISPSSAPTTAAPAPVATTPVAPPTAGSAAPSATASAAREAEAPARAPAPSASVAAASTPPASADTPDEAALASLEKGTGFLYVASPLQTNVYLYGILAGQTNQRLVSKCGPRFIRLGTAPGAWQSVGSVSIVKCGGFTRVDIAP